MPRYIIERSVPGLTRDDLFAAGRRSVAVLADMPDVRWIRSYVSDAEGKIYCEYDAPSPEAILRACPARGDARRSDLPKSLSKSTLRCSCSGRSDLTRSACGEAEQNA